mgnify:CR=1 FL=1
MPRAARLTIALLVALLGSSVVVTPPSVAATADAAIDVVIDDLLPVIPRADSTLAITGRLVNTSTDPIDAVSVRLRTGIDPVRERALIDTIATAPLTPNAPYDNRYFDRTRTIVADRLAPGEQRGFTVRIPMSALRFQQPGTYVVSVEALGQNPAVDEFEERKGIQRTFVPWFPNPRATTPIGLAWLWPLADWPSRDADGAFIDDRTPSELAPGCRLHDLVALGAQFPSTVTWFADPDLLQAAAAMTRGYVVLRDGAPVVGDRSSDAQNWLADLRRALARSTLHALPVADVDAPSMTRAGLSADVIRSVTAAPGIARTVIPTPVQGGVSWAPGGRYDRATANLLATAGVTTLILAAGALPPADGGAITPSGIADDATENGRMDAVLVDTGISSTLGLPQSTAADVVDARQRFLAHTALIATQPGAPAGRVIVAAPPDLRWHPDPRLATALLRATTTAPWLHASSLTEVVNAPRIARKKAPYSNAARSGELAPRYVARIVRTQNRVDRLVSTLTDPIAVAPTFGMALLRTQSSAWRSEPQTGERLLATVNRELSARVTAVRALTSGTVTLSGETGRVPVTIANDGPVSVLVGVQLVGEPTTRLESEPHPAIEVRPGDRVSLDLQARVVGGDPLDVRVQLLTPDGKPFGDPTRITLVSTAYARAAAWVVGVAFAAIAVFVVVGVTRRIMRVRRGSDRSPGEAGPSETVSP